MDVYFCLFQCKKGRWFLFEMVFLTPLGNAGDLHTLTVLHVIFRLSGRELGRLLLARLVLSGTSLPPATALQHWENQTRDVFPVDFVPFSLLLWNAALCIRGSEMWLQRAPKLHHFLLPGGIYVGGIPMAASQAGDLPQHVKDVKDQILSEIVQIASQIRWEASKQTDILHTTTSKTEGENPARSPMDQRRKPQRWQLLFKLSVSSGAPSIACVLKTQLEIQAWAKEQMDSSCFAVCLHLPNELSSPSRSGFQVLLKAEGVGKLAAASSRRRRDEAGFWEQPWGRPLELHLLIGGAGCGGGWERIWDVEEEVPWRPEPKSPLT